MAMKNRKTKMTKSSSNVTLSAILSKTLSVTSFVTVKASATATVTLSVNVTKMTKTTKMMNMTSPFIRDSDRVRIETITEGNTLALMEN